MKTFLVTLFCCVVLAGCSKDMQDNPHPNKTPKTFIWLAPDSTISQGPSRQHLRWWGDDPDGVIRGYLLATGKFTLVDGKPSIPAATAWRWVTKQDSIVAFPLLVKKDTFDIAVRAVDNTLNTLPAENALVFLFPQPYWDRNEDSTYEAGIDVLLPNLTGAMDPVGGYLGMPVLNQPPSVVFAQNPNDPSSVMVQPDTTFTAATFAWVGTDPDGDKTISTYEIALNNPYDSASTVVLNGNVNMITLVVPRDRVPDGTGTVEADLYTGTFPPRPAKLAKTIKGLKLNAYNTFYVRARDVAGDTSRTLAMPDPTAVPARHWFVKNPTSRLLIINDFITNVTGRREDVLQAYKDAVAHSGTSITNYDILDIARGLTAQNKKDGKVGGLVPPFINPALIFTLHLYDVVLWYTDPFPSLGVAHYPLFEYVRDDLHQGRVIYSTMFEVAIDPSGALKDFAPIDSISSVDVVDNDPITGVKLMPLMGDRQIDGGTAVDPDSSSSSIYPPLQFGPKFTYSVYLRGIYNRADARYIYHMPPFVTDPVNNPTIRYAPFASLSDFRSVVSGWNGTNGCAVGVGGTIYLTTDAGQKWTRRPSGLAYNLDCVQMLDASNGWVSGDSGTILKTTDGGVNWINRSVPTFENLNGICFNPGSTIGLAVGTSGILIRSTNGGGTWASPPNITRRTYRAVKMADASVGAAVGDSLIGYTTDGGATWALAAAFPKLFYTSVSYSTPTTATAVARDGSIVRTTDGGINWSLQTKLVSSDCRSVAFFDAQNGWICGNSTDRNDLRGYVITTHDGGASWSAQQYTPVTQHLYSVTGSSLSSLWAVGSNGVIIHSGDAGTNWTTQPQGLINVGVVDNSRTFVFVGLPLHILTGPNPTTYPNNFSQFLNYVLLHEFGL